MSSSRRCVRRAGVRCDRTGSGSYSRGYQLDLAGNRLQCEGSTCTFDNANKILTLSGGSVSYDADGNLTSRYATGQPSLWLSWNDLSQVTQIGGASLVTLGYDGLGRRVCATSTMLMSKTFYIFDGDLLLGEVQPSMYIAPPGMPQPAPTITAAYTWGAAGLVSQRRVSAGASLWYAFGPQGETRQLTSSTGAVVDTYSYTAYGVRLSVTGSDTNPFRYGGQAACSVADRTTPRGGAHHVAGPPPDRYHRVGQAGRQEPGRPSRGHLPHPCGVLGRIGELPIRVDVVAEQISHSCSLTSVGGGPYTA